MLLIFHEDSRILFGHPTNDDDDEPSNAVLTPKKSTQGVTGCARATDSRVCTHQHSRHGSAQ